MGNMFTLHDLRKQLVAARNPSLLQKMMLMMPGMSEIRKILNVPDAIRGIGQQIGVIDSMTFAERRDPKICNLARRKRIARGAGVQVSLVNELIRMFESMEPIVRRIQNDGLEDDE